VTKMYMNVLRPAQTRLIPGYKHNRSTSMARERRDKQQNCEQVCW